MASFYSYLRTIAKLNKGSFGFSIAKHFSLYKEWQAQIKSGKMPLELEMPWISLASKYFLDDYFSKIKEPAVVFEYGSGGSTLYFLNKGCRVFSVEHDELWFNKLCKNEKIMEYSWQGKFLPPQSLNGQKKRSSSDPDDYGSGAEIYAEFHFKDYVTAIENSGHNNFDLILIDGRSRPSCIKHSLHHIKKGGLIVIDNAEREYYQVDRFFNQDYELAFDHYGALISMNQFTKTTIYKKIK